MKRQRLVLALLLWLSIFLVFYGCNAQHISLARRTVPLGPYEDEVAASLDPNPLPTTEATIHLPGDRSEADNTEEHGSMQTQSPAATSSLTTDDHIEDMPDSTSMPPDDVIMAHEARTQGAESRENTDRTMPSNEPVTTTRTTSTSRSITSTTRKPTTTTTASMTTKGSETTSQKTTTTTKASTSKTTTTKKESGDTVARTETDKNYKYMGNSRSKILHLTTCDSASRTAMANRVYFKTREEAIAAGYGPCGRCKP